MYNISGLTMYLMICQHYISGMRVEHFLSLFVKIVVKCGLWPSKRGNLDRKSTRGLFTVIVSSRWSFYAFEKICKHRRFLLLLCDVLLSIPMTPYNMKSCSEKLIQSTRKSSVSEFREFFATGTHAQEPYSVSLVISLL